jgi:hypothetical protein
MDKPSIQAEKPEQQHGDQRSAEQKGVPSGFDKWFLHIHPPATGFRDSIGAGGRGFRHQGNGGGHGLAIDPRWRRSFEAAVRVH